MTTYFKDSTGTIIWEVTTVNATIQNVRVSDMGYWDGTTFTYYGTTFSELETMLKQNGFTDEITSDDLIALGF
jgi:hypothetical protein